MRVRSEPEHEWGNATSATLERDYGLTGPGSRQAIEAGLADAAWYSPPVDADRMQQLMVRSNGRAARDVVLWLALLGGGAALSF
jgi:hypothetical protein